MNVVKSSTQLKAFTLIELLVAMVILCLVMGLCFTLYQTTFKNYLTLKKVNQQTEEMTSLCKLVGDDFFYSSKVTVTTGSIYFNTATKSVVSYALGDSTILRTQNTVKDTFKLGKINYGILFEGKNKTVGLIDELTFIVSISGEPDTFRFQKNYAADMLIHKDAANESKKTE